MSFCKKVLLAASFLLSTVLIFTAIRHRRIGQSGERKFHVYSIPEDLLYKRYNMRPETCPFGMYSSEIVVPELVKRHEYRYEANPEKASFFIVPQFSSCFYHMCLKETDTDIESCKQRVREYFEDILNWVEDSHPYWERNGGKDHMFVFSWDQGSELLGYNTVLSNRVSSSIHLVHHGKRGINDQNYSIHKDIVIPVFRDYYMADRIAKKEVPKKIFAYFRGTLKDDYEYGHGARKYIRYLGQNKPSLFFVKEGHSEYYWNELAHSTFAFCPAGWSVWSPRFYDALISGSIPVLFDDKWILPFENVIDYSSISFIIKRADLKVAEQTLQDLKRSRAKQMVQEMKRLAKYFRYDDDNITDGPIELMLREVLVKHPGPTVSKPANVLRALDQENSEDY